jgi:CheY-like chemotaxis protein
MFVPAPTVLVAEDEPVLRAYAARALAEAHYRVITASNGLEAIAALDATRGIAAVVTDIQMPNFDGLDVAAFARTLPAPPPVLFISGASRDTILPGAFLRKPFKPQDLVEAVRALLAGHQKQAG